MRYPITDGDDWSVLWTFRTPWDTETLKRRVAQAKQTSRSRQAPFLVNHLAGTLRLASKEHLPAFLREAGLSDAAPDTFRLPEESSAALATLKGSGLWDAAGLPIWMLKSKQHRRVRPLLNATRAALSAAAPALLQRRVRPLLLRGLGRAFDVGLYVLVSSVSPLRIYSYERALVRVCEKPFPTRASGFATADHSSYVINHYAPLWTLPFFEGHLAACASRSAACALRRALAAEGHNATDIWARMESVAGRLLSELRPHSEVGLRRLGLDSEHAFELLRFDFMVDERARPMLTEVNISPNLVAAHEEDGKVKASLLRDTLRIAKVRLEQLQQRRGPQADAAKGGTADGASSAAAELAAAGEFRRIHLPHLPRAHIGSVTQL